LDINRSDIFLRRAVDKGLTKDTEGEILDLKEILKSEPDELPALFRLGVAYQNSRLYQESIKLLSKAIEIKTTEKKEAESLSSIESNYTSGIILAQIYFERAMTYYKNDSLQKAVSDFSFVINNSYREKESYYYRGSSFLKLKMIEKACSDLRESEQLGMLDAKELITKSCK
jgi:tetratricopeptide (TPR) repeat protein